MRIILEIYEAIFHFFLIFFISLDEKKFDNEGRVITAEYDKFYLINTCKFDSWFIQDFCL